MFSLGKPGVILGSYFWFVHISGWWHGPSSVIIRWCHPSMASLCNRNPGPEDPMPRMIQNWDLKDPRLPLPDGAALWSCSKKGEPRIWGVWATPLPTASSEHGQLLGVIVFWTMVDQMSSQSVGRKPDKPTVSLVYTKASALGDMGDSVNHCRFQFSGQKKKISFTFYYSFNKI